MRPVMQATLLALAFLLAANSALAVPPYKQILGDWTSNFGPVHVDLVSLEPATGGTKVKGSWLEGPDKKGLITSGRYDPATKKLTLDYTETWTKLSGHAVLVLDKSATELAGPFKTSNGQTGQWIWKRKRP